MDSALAHQLLHDVVDFLADALRQVMTAGFFEDAHRFFHGDRLLVVVHHMHDDIRCVLVQPMLEA
ncbi:hypothetical protein [Massilia eburnea]|uniref:hypothetical protein n=1 Tax=Massilia eburnea TaxID=1776165 RepID=UPI003D6ADA59